MFRSLDQLIARQRWLDTLGEPLQKTVVSLFAGRGRTGKQVKNLLNGTWLGHPAHPALTDRAAPYGEDADSTAWVPSLPPGRNQPGLCSPCSSSSAQQATYHQTIGSWVSRRR
jgi:hypothetical protein